MVKRCQWGICYSVSQYTKRLVSGFNFLPFSKLNQEDSRRVKPAGKVGKMWTTACLSAQRYVFFIYSMIISDHPHYSVLANILVYNKQMKISSLTGAAHTLNCEQLSNMLQSADIMWTAHHTNIRPVSVTGLFDPACLPTSRRLNVIFNNHIKDMIYKF